MSTSRPADLDSMALRTLMAAFPGPDLPPWARDRLGAGLGSVCLFGSNISSPDQLSALTGAIHDSAPDCLVATDEEGGDVTRLHMREGSPQPGNAALGAADDLRLTAAVAAAIGTELAAAGVDLDLAPVVDVNSNPDNPVIGVRSFGADPALVARHTRAYVEGLQAAGVAACAKHFPGHGDTAVDSHLGLPRLEAPLDLLRARELVPFAAGVDAGSVAVMTSHVLVPAVDPTLAATLSGPVLRLLRDELGFTGLIISDALDMAGAHAGRGEPAAAVLSLAAGCDLLCLGPNKDAAHVDAVVAAVVDAVMSGALPEQRLAEAGDRVLTASRQVQKRRENGGTPSYDGTASAAAARRAIRVAGQLAPVRGACVLRFRTSSNIAVGEVPWGLPENGAVLGGVPHIDVDETTSVEELLSRADGRAVVALVREPHRHAWVADRLERLAAARPDLVTVEMGWPGRADLPGAATVTTFGASRANGAALDAVLAGGR
jgi:beta-N-acetylhexosaminidase